MPRGAAPGERRGGRTKGKKNRGTIEKERVAAEIAARTVMDARVAGKKLAKEVLEEFMFLFAGMAATYQPLPPGTITPPGHEPDPAKFNEYARLTVHCASKLAPYQSPTFAAIAISTPGLPVPSQPSGDNVIRLDDPIALARVYARIVSGSRERKFG